MEQLILHLFGDYLLQSDWAANNKTSNSFACLVHVTLYSLPFLLLRPSLAAFAVVFITHFFIDRFRLAKYVVYAKNFLAPPSAMFEKVQNIHNSYAPEPFTEIKEKYRWGNCQATGYPKETPPFMAIWLLIVADNTIHLTLNYLALKYL